MRSYNADKLPKKNLLSLQIDLKKFEPATDEEKQQHETMRESTRDKELLVVLCRQDYRNMFAKGWRAFANVNCHIPDGTANHTNKLGLRVRRRLPMKTTHNPLRGEALVVLNEIRRNTSSLIALRVVLFNTPTARISVHIGDDEFYAYNFCIDYLHNKR